MKSTANTFYMIRSPTIILEHKFFSLSLSKRVSRMVVNAYNNVFDTINVVLISKYVRKQYIVGVKLNKTK